MPPYDAKRTVELAWRKARPSDHGQCIEIAKQNVVIMLRDSKRPRGAMFKCSVQELRSFVLSAKAGEFDDLIGVEEDGKNTVQTISEHAQTMKNEPAPKNGLDLTNRIIIRATSSWKSCLMHLVFLAAFFVGLGELAHAATGMSPWVTALGSLAGGIAAGSAAYGRRPRKPPD